MTELSELIRKRGICKGRLTNFEKYLKSFANTTACTEVQALEIKLRLSKMEENFTEFDNIQTRIEELVEDEELAAQEGQRSEFESLYYRYMARAQELYRTYKKTSRPRKDSATSSASSCSEKDDDDNTVKESRSSLKGIKLPTIQIPRFSGEFGKWLEFRDTFVSLIHSNPSVNSIQKFHYLRATLDGSAAQIVRSLEFSAANYDVAWSLLCERYDNTRLLIQNHVKALFNEEPMKRESSESIRKLLDSYTKNLRALEILGEPIQSWDTLIIYIVTTKLDSRTMREWEEHKVKYKHVNLDIFTKFLKNRADLLETIEISTNKPNTSQTTQTQINKNYKNIKALVTTENTTQNKIFLCPLCEGEHALYKCEKFIAMPLERRQEFVYAVKLCPNCFRSGHNKRVCRLGPCRICKRKHNSLLHKDFTDTETQQETKTALSVSRPCGQVLLATAIIKIYDNQGQAHEVKAVLDSGSQASFMTQDLLRRLSLRTQDIRISVAGINNAVSSVTKKCNALIQSRLNSFKANVSFLVLPRITSTSSTHTVDVTALKIPANITLADPQFYNPSSAELLLGADIFWDLMGTKQLRINNNYPILQETKLGYVVTGPLGNSRNEQLACHLSQFEEMQELLTKFWAIEEIPTTNKPIISKEEAMCEEHFKQNLTRMDDGRFSVAIPLKMPETVLGDSFDRAKRCFLSLERRFLKQEKLKSMYVTFMKEYADLGHMTKSDINNPPKHSYFLPHHGVLREQSTTTKLRAVFNASAPTTSGLSLNDIQMVGPTIQSDLVAILLRFREHRYVLAGDIEKMYRQVLIHKNQRHLQQIIWRDDVTKPLEAYTLNTVTYGTASAPFLAVRCLMQLANECSNEQIRHVITEDFYVDDLLTGHATAEGLLKIKTQVHEILASGCLNLRKIRSNLPICDEDDNPDGRQDTTALGLRWSPPADEIKFTTDECKPTKITKRLILSTVAQVFDPLGLLSIFVIVGKILLQKLWLHKIQWDDPIPREVFSIWDKFVTNLRYINEIKIPRHIVCITPIDIQLHVFCDASKDAYGACIYARSVETNGNVMVRLLCAKSKVAPIKASTIPRLELCGADAGAKLLTKVLSTTRMTISNCFLWTDSSVVLGWLKTPANKLKQYVKNRVANIQELTDKYTWRHVPTASNPADLLSRGVTAKDYNKMSLWWNGPQFLTENEETWPNKIFDFVESELPEISVNVASINKTNQKFPFSRFSKLSKLRNCMAYVLRFINNCKNLTNRIKGPITHTELSNADHRLLKLAQLETFSEELKILKNGKHLPAKNTLLSLCPFLDDGGLMRVGGRLKNSHYNFDKKHPVLLTAKHPLTSLIFEHEHKRLMHAGPQLLLSSIRELFWPLGGRNLSKQTVHKCLRCFRFRPRTVTPIMGNLPEQRLQPGYPFQVTGMDYAGPIIALNKRGRGSRTEKVYIAIFVCFSTKAIHLELVSDLSKDSFLSALRRFIARRSKPQCLFSDNGTQFVGAYNELKKFFKDNHNILIENMSQENIDFRFIPAYTPHMAGLAEAGVKSVKSHLRRVLGNAHLIFEDLYTVLVQIEAILNSRPLTALSTDPHDLTPLTPGHFLVGRPLSALPTPALEDAKDNRLSRFERLEKMRQQFWNRWQKEYLSELQQRIKWRASVGCLEKDALVLIKDDGLPPLKWSLGRVIKTFPGSDGVGRVADLLTAKGIVRRAFNKICPLPKEESSTIQSQGLEDQPSNAGGHVKN